jgi:hypothetical protein
MYTLTVQIKFINRINTSFIPLDYKKQPKLPMRLRGSDLDHLNVFSKTLEIPSILKANEAWSLEVTRLKSVVPFQISNSCRYGDKLIGSISEREFGSFYIEIYQHYNWTLK